MPAWKLKKKPHRKTITKSELESNRALVKSNLHDMETNEARYMKEFLDNVNKSDIPAEDREAVMLKGLVGIRLTTFAYQCLDSLMETFNDIGEI